MSEPQEPGPPGAGGGVRLLEVAAILGTAQIVVLAAALASLALWIGGDTGGWALVHFAHHPIIVQALVWCAATGALVTTFLRARHAARRRRWLSPRLRVRAIVVAVLAVIVSVLAGTRVIVDFTSGRMEITVAGLVAIAARDTVSSADGPCLATTKRDGHFIEYDGETLYAPFLPLPVDWEDFDGTVERCNPDPRRAPARSR